MKESSSPDNTAAFSEAFFIANLLFIGIFYIALWVLYFLRYQRTSAVAKKHLTQTLMVGGITTSIFILLNIFIVCTDGYASLTALFSLEIYYMLIVPPFLALGIIGFTKAIKDQSYTYPLLGQFSK